MIQQIKPDGTWGGWGVEVFEDRITEAESCKRDIEELFTKDTLNTN